MNRATKVGAGLGLATLAGSASAVVDVTAATTAFGDVGTGVASIGAAMLAAAIGGIVFKWLTAFVL